MGLADPNPNIIKGRIALKSYPLALSNTRCQMSLVSQVVQGGIM